MAVVGAGIGITISFPKLQNQPKWKWIEKTKLQTDKKKPTMRCQETKAQQLDSGTKNENEMIFICDMQYKIERESAFSIPYTLIQI